MAIFYPLLIPLAFLGLLLLPIGGLNLWRSRLAAKRRSPLTKKLLRGPGESLRNAREDVLWDLAISLVMIPLMPLLLYALHITQSYFGGAKETVFRLGIDVLSGMAAGAFLLFRVFKLSRRAQKLRLGYDGEVAVAQELNPLMREGAYVYHDVPGEGFNIDHVVVWAGGVYAVETKARMKPRRDRGKKDAEVIYDGRGLRFPGWMETAPIDQAVRQARWLAQWLSSAVGEPIEVKPVLALPGWFVTAKARGAAILINGTNPGNALGRTHPVLDGRQIQRVAHQLEQRCRDVEPRFFKKCERVVPDA